MCEVLLFKKVLTNMGIELMKLLKQIEMQNWDLNMGEWS